MYPGVCSTQDQSVAWETWNLRCRFQSTALPPPTRIIKKISITPPTQVVQSAVMPLTGTSSRFYNQETSRHSFVHHTFFERVIICQCPTGGILDVDIVVVTTYVNVHRCQEDDGRVQVLMVERPSSLKLRNKQQVHVCRNYGSDQYIKNYYTMCHPMMECLFNELKQSTMRKSSSRKKVLSLSRRNSSTPVTCALMPH